MFRCAGTLFLNLSLSKTHSQPLAREWTIADSKKGGTSLPQPWALFLQFMPNQVPGIADDAGEKELPGGVLVATASPTPSASYRHKHVQQI